MKTYFENFLHKAVYQAQIEDLKEKHKEKGFEGKIGAEAVDKQFDLLLHHKETDKVVAFEVEIEPISKNRLEEIDRLKETARKLGYGFRMIVIFIGGTPKIEINWLQLAFLKYLRVNLPDDIEHKVFTCLWDVAPDNFAKETAHVHIENTAVFLESITIADETAEVLTEGSIAAKLENGSDGHGTHDNNMRLSESFPFTAEMTLNLLEKHITNVNLKVDTSTFY